MNSGSEAMVRMTVPACENPTVIRMRYRSDETGVASFAEVRIYRDRAEGRLQTPAGEQRMEAISLPAADRHQFVGVTVGGGAGTIFPAWASRRARATSAADL